MAATLSNPAAAEAAASQAGPRPVRIALIGNPNSGKTSLFNQLTGLNQKVGNFPGVTVDRKTGVAQLTPGQRAEIIDLPGTYSLYPKSLDEKVITDLLYDKTTDNYPDFVVVTVDASNLRRSLLLFTQLGDLGLPAVLALNMMDVAERHGVNIDLPALERELGVPIIPMNARNGIGIAALKIVMAQRLDTLPVRCWEPDEKLLPMVRQIRYYFDLHNDYLALHYAQQYRQISFLSADEKAHIQELTQQYDFDATAQQAAETIARYARINEILLETVTVTRTEQREPVSNRIDRVLTHRVGGYLIFLGILFLLFQAIFAWAQYPMDWIDQGISGLSATIQDNFHGPLIRLLTEGVLAGLGGVLIFIPQIALLFGFLAVLEETGYMARVTFLMDKLMRPFGLSGKSVVPLISGLACAVPAIMGARTIESWKDRMITIFVTPLMSCSARIPVYTVLVALVVPDRAAWGIFNLRGVALMTLYLLGLFSALGSAWALKKLLKARERSYFIMEFPVYQWPRWKNVGLTIYQKVQAFVLQAGKVIVAISVLLWVLASYGPGNRQDEAVSQLIMQQNIGFSSPEAMARYNKEHPEYQEDMARRVASARLENSYAGTFGHLIEPAIRPLGYDWKIGIALLTSFAAREVFVGTISTIYSVGQDADMGTLQQKLSAERDDAGQPFFTPARAFSLLVFYVFAMQCMSTLAVTYRETKSWRWPLAQLVYMTGLAYAAAFVVYQVLK
ncbi:ferrous iron transport protein B [Hymenobacter sp. M29]|uniref:Ferrous iron transport protein B n=1 Tax=Hymenobacter mellowenesis TaxID=3063995 RepID=A0ABT9AFY4_9BACT|nr:ferrous iron transport protein B [Hymenobacter sp. M29]MDO7848739.1 ferrous iron transport protein B [Hymenobacter sp. M29]